jgi:putative aminopeptidase FrvX
VTDLSHEIRLLTTLSNAFGPPGNEEKMREILKKELEEYADELRVDKLGNIFFFHQGKERSPNVMLARYIS